MTKLTHSRDFKDYPNATPNPQGLIECVVLPLGTNAVYPSVVTPVALDNEAAQGALEAAQNTRRTLIGLLPRENAPSNPQPDHLYGIGVEIAPGHPVRLPKGLHILVEGRRFVEIVQFTQLTPYLVAQARLLPDAPRPRKEIETAADIVRDLFARNADLNEAWSDELVEHILDADLPFVLANLVVGAIPLSLEESQRFIETRQLDQRLNQAADALSRSLSVLEVQDDINAQVQQEIERGQREVYLREQMRVIQTELGELDFFQQELDEVREQIAKAGLPQEAQDKAMKELSRLTIMPPMAPEVGIVRTYLDWLTTLPWSQTSEDNLDISHAQQVLDAEHYGLPKVKDRILEYIAVRKLAEAKMKSPILCFVGPPGVGKTSLGRSIAKALGRQFVRVSLGGVRDEAEIRGHRRTYIGALPGRILQTMKRAGTLNPVFMLDEVDKLGNDFRGDPSAALLEVLDPEQNHAFSDHYLEVSYDLSKVLFITTANDLDPMPDALIDRMEVIEFTGYTEEEKLAITRQYLLPAQYEAHGLAGLKINFDNRALQTLVREYTYEAGVRNLNREVANVCRKIARLHAEGKAFPKRVTSARVHEYLGPAYYLPQNTNKEDTVGLVTGLVWTYNGGDITMIEVSVLSGKGTLLMTGQLGDVMQESAQAALSYTRSRARDLDLLSDDFESYDVHIHLPEGAVPKDGPSAGITLAIGIISAFTERKVRSDFAMTGEITLRGKVLPVGGVKEKVLAARRAGIRKIILPAENRKDLVDVPKEAQADLTFYFVSDMQQVIDKVLLAPPKERLRDIYRAEEEKDDEESTKDKEAKKDK